MSDSLRRRRLTADRTVPVRRRLATLEHEIPYPYGEDDDERPLPDTATIGEIVGHLYAAVARDRKRFGTLVRAHAPEISDDDLAALTDEAARLAPRSVDT